MQATLYGAYCATKSEIVHQQMETRKDVIGVVDSMWNDEDIDVLVDDTETSASVSKKPIRIFNAFIEDWEEAAIRKKDIVNQQKLLKKFANLHWFDPDTGKNYTSKEELVWLPKNKSKCALFRHFNNKRSWD